MIIISFLLLILGLAYSWFSNFVSYIVGCLFEIYFHFSFRIFNCGVCVYTNCWFCRVWSYLFPLELELQAVNCKLRDFHAENWTQVLWEKQYLLLTMDPSLQPTFLYFLIWGTKWGTDYSSLQPTTDFVLSLSFWYVASPILSVLRRF